MTWLVVVWLGFKCPGGMLSGLWPAATRPFACEPQPFFELYDPARERQARERVAALGPGSALYACRGSVCKKRTDWVTSVRFQEVGK